MPGRHGNNKREHVARSWPAPSVWRRAPTQHLRAAQLLEKAQMKLSWVCETSGAVFTCSVKLKLHL